MIVCCKRLNSTAVRRKKIFIVNTSLEIYYPDDISNKILQCYRHYIIYFLEEARFSEYDNHTCTMEVDNVLGLIDECDLIVVIMSKTFFEVPFAYAEEYIGHAISSNKHILPIVIDNVSEEEVNRKLGDRQLIHFNSPSFLEKLEHYINLVFDPYVEQVKNPWISDTLRNVNIFLSYRKKDHRKALEVLNTIHSIRGCEALTVWYDDFLVPGENFNKTIKEQLSNADFVVMCITESTLDPENYVAKVEYPMARKLKKNIIPIAVEDVDLEILSEMYPGIEEVINSNNILVLSSALNRVIVDLGIEFTPRTSADLGELGYCFLTGNGVEKNLALGLELTKQAALQGYSVSCERLGRIYFGIEHQGLVKINYKEASNWFAKSLILTYQHLKRGLKQFSAKEIWSYCSMVANTALHLFDLYFAHLEDVEHALECAGIHMEMALLYSEIGFESTKINTGLARYLRGLCLEDMGDNEMAMSLYNEAEGRMSELATTNFEAGYVYYSKLLISRAQLREKIMETYYSEDYFFKTIQDYRLAAEQLLCCVEDFSTQHESLIECLSHWHDFVIKYDRVNNSKKVNSGINNSNYYIYSTLKKIGDYNTLKASLLRAINAVDLACFGADVPDISLLFDALEYAKTAVSLSPKNHNLQNLLFVIEKRIELWPLNLG